jgi:ornithine decarboxylase
METIMTTLLEAQDEQLRTLLTRPFVRNYLDNAGELPVLLLEPERAGGAYRELVEAFPGVDFHYALKALAHPAIVREIMGQGGFFDAATNAEIDLLANEGVDFSRVIHTHPYKKVRDIQHAYARGVRVFVVDSMVELLKFTDFPEARVLIRLSYSNAYARVDLSSKFGVGQAEARALLEAAQDVGVNVGGFSYHPGSQLSNLETFVYAAEQTRAFIESLEGEGHTIEILDMGGGFPVSHTAPELSVQHIAAAINPILEPLRERMRILAEPGRVVAAPTMTLIASVVGVAEGSTGQWYMLDDGLYGSYSNILTEDVHPYIISERQLLEPEVETHLATLGGPTCDSSDVIARDLPLPRLTVGDRILSPMMGAYTSVTATEFNGIPRTPIIVVS